MVNALSRRNWSLESPHLQDVSAFVRYGLVTEKGTDFQPYLIRPLSYTLWERKQLREMRGVYPSARTLD